MVVDVKVRSSDGGSEVKGTELVDGASDTEGDALTLGLLDSLEML